ncbi:MAG: thiamine phosphate synthase [bacterium]
MRQLTGLYAITPSNKGNLVDSVKHALQGGASVVQYREKMLDREQQLTAARSLKALCDEHQALFLINDDVELALACNADGVHLGQQDCALPVARRKLGNDKIIGISCYNQLSLAEEAAAGGANYIAFGRFFASRTKPDARQADLELLANAKQRISLPVVAIGGITTDNAPAVVAAGADMLAVIDGLFAQPDIQATAHAFSTLYQQGTT